MPLKAKNVHVAFCVPRTSFSAHNIVDIQYVYIVGDAPVLTESCDQKNFGNYLLFKYIKTVICLSVKF